ILFIDKKGERSYLHLPGASAEIKINDKIFSQIRNSKILHIGGALIIPGLDGKPMSKLLQFAKDNNLVTSVDLAWDSSNEWMNKLKYSLPFIDILMLNQDELKALTKHKSIKTSAGLLHRYGIKIVIVKMGADGVFISKDLLNFFVPTIKVHAIDTTGAGDNFSAGFLYGILKGWNIIDSAKLGNLLGALAVENFGGTSGFINHKKTLELLSKYYDINNYT
ncbi:MAG: carbohydrate kinase family protein, partial [Ignavibacteria bacterium]|nr:carbohydrate kinase family protein [Ignavibacteria bacterium]